MEAVLQAVGAFVAVSAVFGGLLLLILGVARLILRSKPPRFVGAQLPVLNESIDLTKRYDIVYGAGSETPHEKLSGVRILGYLQSDRDETARGEYSPDGGRWLVVELADGRRAYLRPRSILWLLEAAPTSHS